MHEKCTQFCTDFCIKINDRNAPEFMQTICVPIPVCIPIFARSSALVLPLNDNENEDENNIDYGTKT